MHTPDEPEPTRRFYDLKPKQSFERQNGSSAMPSDAPTDVRDMFRLASGAQPPLHNRRSSDRNQVHDLLDLNLRKEIAAGGFEVVPGVDTKAIARRRKFWMPLIVANGFGLITIFTCYSNDAFSAPIFFFLGGIGAIDAVLLFHAFVLRTE